jgi:hypothetical protein
MLAYCNLTWNATTDQQRCQAEADFMAEHRWFASRWPYRLAGPTSTKVLAGDDAISHLHALHAIRV